MTDTDTMTPLQTQTIETILDLNDRLGRAPFLSEVAEGEGVSVPALARRWGARKGEGSYADAWDRMYEDAGLVRPDGTREPYNKIFSDEEAEELARRYREEEITHRELAEEYDTTATTIFRTIKRVTE